MVRLAFRHDEGEPNRSRTRRADSVRRHDHIGERRSLGVHPATGPDERDDRAIVDAVLAGDRDAFRVLVDREGASVVRACHRVLGDLHEAEDAAQEAFVTAYRSLASWRGDGPFGAWLTRIGVRIALRQAGTRRSVAWLDPADESPMAQTGDASIRGRDRRGDGGDRLDGSIAPDRARRTRRRRPRLAVAALPEPYREVVTLRFFGELSLDEIARQTERPLGTVKTHLHRGLLRLRGTVEPTRRRVSGPIRPVRSVRAARPRRARPVGRRAGRCHAGGARARDAGRECHRPSDRRVRGPGHGRDRRPSPRPGSSSGRARPSVVDAIGAFFMTIRESWGVATTGGRPMAVRAQALAFVLLVVVATGTLTGVGAIGVGASARPKREPVSIGPSRPRP